jgi:fucose 4-O-acetylase-like acetyltransferase
LKNREYYFDNIKGILIMLVIFGHLIEFSVIENKLSKEIYTYIYFFHMPAFILISGFFAKKSLEQIKIKELMLKLGLPYVIFQTIYLYFHNSLFDYKFEHTLMTPYWILWFLFSLIFWHILSYIFNQLKYGLLYAFVIGVLAGMYNEFGTSFGLSRTLIFFPFFFLGIKLKKKHFTLIKNNTTKLISVFFLIVFYFFIQNLSFFNYEFLWGSTSYKFNNLSDLRGIIYRTIQYIVALMLIVSLFSLVPRKKLFISNIGIYTLYIFLLHGFLIKGIQYLFPEFLSTGGITQYLNFIVISILFSLLFTIPFVRKLFSPLVEPIKYLKK